MTRSARRLPTVAVAIVSLTSIGAPGQAATESSTPATAIEEVVVLVLVEPPSPVIPPLVPTVLMPVSAPAPVAPPTVVVALPELLFSPRLLAPAEPPLPVPNSQSVHWSLGLKPTNNPHAGA